MFFLSSRASATNAMSIQRQDEPPFRSVNPTEEGSTDMDSQLARIQTELTAVVRRANLVASPLRDNA